MHGVTQGFNPYAYNYPAAPQMGVQPGPAIFDQMMSQVETLSSSLAQTSAQLASLAAGSVVTPSPLALGDAIPGAAIWQQANAVAEDPLFSAMPTQPQVAPSLPQENVQLAARQKLMALLMPMFQQYQANIQRQQQQQLAAQLQASQAQRVQQVAASQAAQPQAAPQQRTPSPAPAAAAPPVAARPVVASPPPVAVQPSVNSSRQLQQTRPASAGGGNLVKPGQAPAAEGKRVQAHQLEDWTKVISTVDGNYQAGVQGMADQLWPDHTVDRFQLPGFESSVTPTNALIEPPKGNEPYKVKSNYLLRGDKNGGTHHLRVGVVDANGNPTTEPGLMVRVTTPDGQTHDLDPQLKNEHGAVYTEFALYGAPDENGKAHKVELVKDGQVVSNAVVSVTAVVQPIDAVDAKLKDPTVSEAEKQAIRAQVEAESAGNYQAHTSPVVVFQRDENATAGMGAGEDNEATEAAPEASEQSAAATEPTATQDEATAESTTAEASSSTEAKPENNKPAPEDAVTS